jgi:cytochrome c biogenesis protein CcdA
MDFMLFMEQMGTSEIAIVAAFFIGLMTAISPCPLATNITAIAYTSKRMKGSRHTLIVASLYTIGRMLTYAGIACMIVYAGLSTQHISLFLQSYGERLLGPLLLVIGLVMLEAVKLGRIAGDSEWVERLKKRLAERGFLGAFLLGVVFALAFCPFSAVLYFGMLIPLSLAAGDGIVLPAVFAVATGLPVIVLSLALSKGVSTLGSAMNKIQTFEEWTRKAAGVVFIVAGIYYIIQLFVL